MAVTVTGGVRGLAPKRYLAEPAFLDEMKALFWRRYEREADAYERLIYNLHPPADGERMNGLLAFRDLGAVPALGKREHEERLARVMRTIRWPAVEPLLDVANVEGLTLPRLSTILHFHHPAYPIYSRALVEGLNALGIPVVYRETVDEESVADYAGVIAAIERLKSHVTFENVPESNCFLTRVMEAALVEYATAPK